jgi:hypothetical protein
VGGPRNPWRRQDATPQGRTMEPNQALQLLQQTANDYASTLPPAARSCTSQALTAAMQSLAGAMRDLEAANKRIASITSDVKGKDGAKTDAKAEEKPELKQKNG